MKKITLLFICLLMLSCSSKKRDVTKNVIRALKHSQPVVYLKDGAVADSSVVVKRKWHDHTCESVLRNTGNTVVHVKQVILFKEGHLLPASTPFYGGGFQMLSQTGGTLAHVKNIGNYRDAGLYRLPEPSGYHVV